MNIQVYFFGMYVAFQSMLKEFGLFQTTLPKRKERDKMKRATLTWKRGLFLASLCIPTLALAEAAPEKTVADSLFVANNVWMMICAGLVFWMNLGFASVESGLTQSKNAVNILFKNVFIPLLGLVTYALWGFHTMYPGDFNNFFSLGGPIAVAKADTTIGYASGGYTYWTDFLFQAMFAATAATIVSGAVAERIKLNSFMFFSLLYVGITYPIVGSWGWGGGWLKDMGFYDFAGSTLVHSVGGWGALVGAWMLGPRIGKYIDGKIHPIPGHNMGLATIGVFILWLGWFGFNGGSVLSADPAATSLVLVTTCLAAATGGMGATFTSWFISKKPDLSMALNGVLAGLVGITAGADQMGIADSLIIGAIAGIAAVFAVMFFDKVKIDDPVGALSVHLIGGIIGTLAVGVFGAKAGLAQFKVQLIGVLAVGAASALTSFIFFYITKLIMGLRVSKDEELEGLDIGEHGMVAYGDFVVSRTH